jgi:hypothetical protein
VNITNVGVEDDGGLYWVTLHETGHVIDLEDKLQGTDYLMNKTGSYCSGVLGSDRKCYRPSGDNASAGADSENAEEMEEGGFVPIGDVVGNVAYGGPAEEFADTFAALVAYNEGYFSADYSGITIPEGYITVFDKLNYVSDFLSRRNLKHQRN